MYHLVNTDVYRLKTNVSEITSQPLGYLTIEGKKDDSNLEALGQVVQTIQSQWLC